MRISKPEFTQQDGDFLCRVHVCFAEGSDILWYSLRGEYADLVSDRSDAPLVALLIRAMACGEDIHLDGTISERLYYNLSRSYQHVLRAVIPSLRLINIYPADVQPATQRASGVATGFSGGIDSFSVLADHHYTDVPTGFRLTHLLYNNVGSHEKGGSRLFRERYEHIRPAAERIGLPFIAVDTNVSAFYTGFKFQQTHTPRNASVALLLQRGIGRFLYASTFSYADAYIGPSYDMAYSDTVTLPLLSTEALDAFSVGSEYTRVEKTLHVASIEDSYRDLDVCVRDNKGRNCSTCWKCMRTLLTLEIAGLLDRYAGAFDLNAYRQGRERYIAQVLQSKDPLQREVLSFARERGFVFPLPARLQARMHVLSVDKQAKRVVGLRRRVARKIKRVLQRAA